MNRSPWRLLVLSIVVALGCSDSNLGVVTGTVKVDGEPAKNGSIAFFPVDGKSSTAGAPIVDGKYTAEVPTGETKIEIRVSKVVGQKRLYETPDSPIQPILAEVLPPRYNNESELSMDVQPGENVKHFDLKSK
jgi:hypothetical protein